MSLFFQSIWTKWEREKYILMLSNPLRVSVTLFSSGSPRIKRNSPSYYCYISLSWGWTICLEYGMERNPPIGMGTAFLSEIRYRYLRNTHEEEKHDNDILYSESEGLSGPFWRCLSKQWLCCGAGHPVMDDHISRCCKLFQDEQFEIQDSVKKAWL